MRGEDWPLVGRERELSAVQARLERRDPGVILAGPAGVGKSRLGRESLVLAQSLGYVPTQVIATRATAGLPLGALAPLLPPADERRPTGADGPGRLLRRSAAGILGLAGGGRLALLMDDGHLLDDASARLLRLLAESGRAFLIVTVRAGDPAPSSLADLWEDGLVARLDVPALDDEAIGVLVEEALGGAVEQGTTVRLAARAAGNALFLRELLVGALESGALVDVGGLWRLVVPLSPSQRLVEIVETRLRGLVPAERELLEVLSYAEPLGAGDVARWGATEAAGALERRGILCRRVDGRRVEVGLAHPIFGDVVRQQLPAMRVRTVARKLADIVEATGSRRREDTLRVATWRLDGGGGDPSRLLAAATTARWRYDFALAERLARAAADAGAGFQAALLAAQLAALQGRRADAEAQLALLATEARTDAERGDVAVNRLDNLVFQQGRVDQALRIIEQAEAQLTDPRWCEEIAARRQGLRLATHGPQTYAELDAASISDVSGRALVWTWLSEAYGLARLGRVEAAIDLSTRGHAAHIALTEPLDWDPCLHVHVRCDALAYAGWFHEAEALATAHYHQGVREGNVDAQAYFAYHLGKTVGERGHVGRAAGHLREAVALFTEVGRPLLVQLCLTYLALAEALAGRPEQARQVLQRRDEIGVSETMYVAVDVLGARAWTEVAAGDVPAACRRLQEAVALAGEIGDLVGQASSLHGLARLGHPEEVEGALRGLASRMEGRLVSARADHARALTNGDVDGLASVAADFDMMGADLLAAEAAADTAVAARRLGRRLQSEATQQHAARLRVRCDGAVTPALQAVEGRAVLTRAERDVALLAAGGHTNQEIAGKLRVSVRTAANHLQHAYKKLGIHRRSELTEALDLPRNRTDRS